ncbi:MAG: BMP family protein [Gemmatimonadaceae bacterium]|nr:BMP family protein [Gemmatimonadaceae bacterium]
MTYSKRRGFGAPFSTLVSLSALALLNACAPPDSPSKADSTTGAAQLRVALLTPGPISDQAWNGGAYAGLQRIRDSLGARISHIQTKTPAEFDENFRLYGEQGYSLVIGHGFEYQDAAGRIAPEFPRTTYVTTSGTLTGPNIAGLEFAFEDGAYLAGIVAGATTKTGTIGAIGGQEIPPVKRSFYAFEQGARSVNPSIRVITSYIGNWDDASAGKEQALAQIGRGADVIFQNADAAGFGIFQAAREARGVRVFGANSDQNAVAPEVVLGSVVIDLPHAFLLVARELQAGTFKPRVIALGMKTDVVRLVLNPQLRSTIPATALAAVDSVTKRLITGDFTAPVPPAAATAK